MNEYSVNPISWFSERELSFTPKHFVVANTALTEESTFWVHNTLKGRFSVMYKAMDDDMLFSVFIVNGCPAFEDPKEAIIYELTWS